MSFTYVLTKRTIRYVDDHGRLRVKKRYDVPRVSQHPTRQAELRRVQRQREAAAEREIREIEGRQE